MGALALLGRTERPEAWQERSETVFAFASLAAAALANAQLHRTTEYGAAESTFLLQISQLLASTLQVRRIAQRVAGDASALTGSDICAIYRYDVPADALELMALQGVAPDRVVANVERLSLAELPLTWKAAQEALIGTLAEELKGSPVTANVLRVRTIDVEASPEAAPGGRGTTPEEIAAAVLFLCSHQSSVINGARIPLYGSA